MDKDLGRLVISMIASAAIIVGGLLGCSGRKTVKPIIISPEISYTHEIDPFAGNYTIFDGKIGREHVKLTHIIGEKPGEHDDCLYLNVIDLEENSKTLRAHGCYDYGLDFKVDTVEIFDEFTIVSFNKKIIADAQVQYERYLQKIAKKMNTKIEYLRKPKETIL